MHCSADFALAISHMRYLIPRKSCTSKALYVNRIGIPALGSIIKAL